MEISLTDTAQYTNRESPQEVIPNSDQIRESSHDIPVSDIPRFLTRMRKTPDQDHRTESQKQAPIKQ